MFKRKILKLDSEDFKLEQNLLKFKETALISDLEKHDSKIYLLQTISQCQSESSNRELISSQDALVKNDLTVIKNNVKLSLGKKYWLRQQILERIQIPHFNWIFVNRIARNMIAVFLLFMFVVGSLVLLPINYRLTKASKWTYLENVNGEVYINRDGKILQANPNVSLQEGDIIVTRKNSAAVVRFMDDSVTRLGADTSLQIETIGVDNGHGDLETQISLLLANGRVWAHVVNLMGTNSHFVIETKNAKTKATTKASFEVTAISSITKVSVYENSVDLSGKLGLINNPQTIIKGYSAEVDNVSLKLHNGTVGISSKIILAKVNNVPDQWVQNNLKLDQKHQGKLLSENQTFINNALEQDQGIAGMIADIKDMTLPYFKTPAIERVRIAFLQVHMNFLKAEQLLGNNSTNNTDRTDSLKYIYSYRNFMKDLVSKRAELELQNKNESIVLFKLINANVDSQVKVLAMVLPDNNLFLAKKVINEVTEILSPTQADLIKNKLLILRESLFDTEGLIDKRNFKLAQFTFQQYLSSLDDVVNLINKENIQNNYNELYDLLNEQVKQLKLLNSLEIKLRGVGDKYFVTVVMHVEKNSLNKLIQIISVSRDKQIPYSLLMQLYSFVQTYSDNREGKTEALLKLGKILDTYTEFQQMKKLKKQQSDQLKNTNINSDSLNLKVNDMRPIIDFQATTELNGNNISTLKSN